MSADDPLARTDRPRTPWLNDLARFVTIVLATVLACGLFCLRPAVDASARIDLLAEPERSVARIFERDIELEEAASGCAGWQRKLIAAVLEDEPSDMRRAAIDAYREVLARPLARRSAALGASSDGDKTESASASGARGASTPSESAPQTTAGGASAPLDGGPDERETAENAALVRGRELARAELRARLALLLFEEQQADAAHSALEENERRASTLEPAERERVAALAAALACAYGAAVCTTAYAEHDLALLAPGWALDRLRLQLARRTGADDVVRGLENAAAQEAEHLRSKLVLYAFGFALPLVIGIAALLVWLWRGRPLSLSTSTPIPPVWTFAEGTSVLVRSAAAGIAVSLLLVISAHALEVHALAAWVTLLASLPMLWFLRRRLLVPYAIGFARTFGLERPRGGALAWGAWTAGVFAVGEVGTRVIRFACTAAGSDVHWSEALLEGLLAGDAATAWLDAIDAIAWAPFFEEVGCRGLLYLTLRRRFGAVGAAIASALVFGALHQSSLPFFLTACWYGLVWAVAFEQTRGLWPVIVCHGLTNVMVVGAGALFYR